MSAVHIPAHHQNLLLYLCWCNQKVTGSNPKVSKAATEVLVNKVLSPSLGKYVAWSVSWFKGWVSCYSITGKSSCLKLLDHQRLDIRQSQKAALWCAIYSTPMCTSSHHDIVKVKGLSAVWVDWAVCSVSVRPPLSLWWSRHAISPAPHWPDFHSCQSQPI